MKMKVLLTGLAVSLLALAPAIANQVAPRPTAQTAPQPTESFNVVGTEPFWNMTIDKTGITYSTPDTQKTTFPSVAPLSAQGRPGDNVRVYPLKGKTSGNLVIRQGACSDSMSDRKYDYSATLILGNTVKEGCAFKK
ncbi:MAG: hypothetical protein C4288_16260 [Leptolyngbya sp. ERB_1_1]